MYYALQDDMGIRLRRNVPTGPQEKDCSAWRKGKVKTSQACLLCFSFPFPPGNTGLKDIGRPSLIPAKNYLVQQCI